MAIAIWIMVAVVIALLSNVFESRNMVANTIAAFLGALLVGGGYALYYKGAETATNALTTATWENFTASVVGAILFVIVAQLFSFEWTTLHKHSS